MRIAFVLLLWICSTSIVLAQYKVRFVVKEKTIIKHDSIYITGSFNDWDSAANKKYKLEPYGVNERSIVLSVKPGKIEYKFTRGNWLTVEKQFGGGEVPNRVVTINKDTTLRDSISNYRDQFLSDNWLALSMPQPDTIRIALLSSIAAAYANFPD